MAEANIVRLPVVKQRTGLSRSTIYNRISSGELTPPVLIGDRAVGWPENEIAAINAARIAGKTKAEIRALVADLKEARKTLGAAPDLGAIGPVGKPVRGAS